MQRRSPAETCARLLGVLLLAAGVAGFFYNGTFTSNEHIHDDMLGIFRVNGWSNTLNVLLGIWGLAAVAAPGTRAYGYGAGLVLVALGVWGFVLGTGQSILSIVPVNAADNWARLLLGIAALLAAAFSSARQRTTTARAAA